jgi:hypothetical protein
VKSLVPVGLGLALLLVPSLALADRTPQERALAETLFRDAKALVAAGKIAEACPKFAESQRLDPTTGTMMHLATCHEEEGKTATAWVEFGEAANMAGKARQSERERTAQKAARALEAKLSKLVITVTAPPPGLAVTFDGVALSGASMGTPLPFDPGPHVLEAKAPNKKVYTATITVTAGPSTTAVPIPALEDEAPPPAAAPPAPPPSPPPPPPPPPSGGGGQKTVGLVLGAVGLASIGAGAFFGLRASSQTKDADAFCTGTLCSAEGLAGHDDAHTSALVSTLTFGAGAALVGLGAYLFFSAKSEPAAAGRVRMTPRVGLDGARVLGEVAW